MGNGDGVSGIGQLADHFLVTEDLRGMGTGHSKGLPKERWFLNRRQEEHIFSQHRLNHRVPDIPAPTNRILT